MPINVENLETGRPENNEPHEDDSGSDSSRQAYADELIRDATAGEGRQRRYASVDRPLTQKFGTNP